MALGQNIIFFSTKYVKFVEFQTSTEIIYNLKMESQATRTSFLVFTEKRFTFLMDLVMKFFFYV